jgi:UDP-N-acetylglucosamine 4,6-dehydratase
LIATKRWPCYFFDSDTTGEKDFEEFFTADESLDMDRFQNIGVIRNEPAFDSDRLDRFVTRIAEFKAAGLWDKSDLVALFHEMIPDFAHKETGKYLDARM